ncbi:MAG: ATP-binding protein [Candidatus Promineifilaceae bacterium]|nr:ATP-binding protein [Candidatus Promineifilaceae bacterium]
MARALVDVRILQREYLLAISRAMTAELHLHDLLRLILQSAVELVSGQAGMVALLDPDSKQLRVAAIYGIPAELVDHFAPLLHDLPDAEEGEREELMRRLHLVAKEANLAFTQVIRLPMRVGGDVIGLIFIFQSGNYYFVPDASNLLRSFAEQAAIAVKNAWLYQQINNEKQRLDALLEHSADGIMILDPSLRITVFNKALSIMTGWPAERAIGRHHSEIIRWKSLKTPTDLADAINSGWPLPGASHLYVEGETACFADDCVQGRATVSLGITYAPLLDENGQLTTIIADVRDLTRYREEEELQKTFISVISHELKTPVSIIKGYAGTLRRQDARWSKEVLEDSLSVIEEEADNLNELIDSLLEVSRLQAGTFRLVMSDDVMLPNIAASVAQKLGRQSESHDVAVYFDPDFPTIIGDERRLTQVLNNLVSNAIKYSPDGSTVVINGEVHPHYVTVSVRDEGIGIPLHEQDRIFQKFARLDNALSRKTEGTGLGLFLSKAIIEAHNGRIWFQNNSKSEMNAPGTTFTFSLPMEQLTDKQTIT